MISGIAICNACLKPCRVQIDPMGIKVQSRCCKASVVHKNVRLTLEADG